MPPASGSTPSNPSIVELTPRIFSAKEHPITLEMIDRDALHVIKKLNNAGHSGYLVGGGVRDLYLGTTPKDFDISTDARPGQIRKLFPNSTIIGKRFRLVQVFFHRSKVIEVSTLRSLSEFDLEGPESVLAPNNTFGTLDQDAQRRDLTINSLFFDIRNKTIIDYVDGVGDLDRSIIRMVGEPNKRINRDPVRMMRAIRHSARNNFIIEAETWKAICANNQKLALCPSSRLRDEMFKDLYSGAAAAWFELAVDSEIFFTLLPLYRKIFVNHPTDTPHPRVLLSKLAAVLDRLITGTTGQKSALLPDFFVLALLLIPWAEMKYHLFSLQPKGSALFQITKRIRTDLDQDLGVQLNLRRSLRQETTALLANLAVLLQHRHNDSWPKWLRNKTYFPQASLLYSCYMEALSGNLVPDQQLEILPLVAEEPRQPVHERESQRKGKPAFSSKSKGGIFGFRKK